MARKRMSDEERAAWREQKRKDAEQALDELLTVEGWANWLRLRRTLHEYSWTNQVLIATQAAAQDIVPVLVKSAGKWKQDGYHPAKGTRGLYVWVPHQRGKKDAPVWTCCGQTIPKGKGCGSCGKTSTYFLLRAVFDASQVRSYDSGLPPDIDVPVGQPIEGDELGWMVLPLVQWGVDEGDVLTYNLAADLEPGTLGQFNHRTLHLDIAGQGSGNAKLRVSIHELAHAHGVTSKDLPLTYAEAEVAADCVAYIVSSVAGLDTSADSIPYIAGWGGEDAKQKIRKLAALIDSTAKALERPIVELLAEHHEREEVVA